MIPKELFPSTVMWRLRSWNDIRSASWFTLSNYSTFFMILFLVVVALLQTRSKIVSIHHAHNPDDSCGISLTRCLTWVERSAKSGV